MPHCSLICFANCCTSHLELLTPPYLPFHTMRNKTYLVPYILAYHQRQFQITAILTHTLMISHMAGIHHLSSWKWKCRYNYPSVNLIFHCLHCGRYNLACKLLNEMDNIWLIFQFLELVSSRSICQRIREHTQKKKQKKQKNKNMHPTEVSFEEKKVIKSSSEKFDDQITCSQARDMTRFIHSSWLC